MPILRNEHVVRYIRKHWILFVFQVIPLFILALVPAIFPEFVRLLLPDFLGRFANILWAFYFMWLMVLWVYGFVLWTEYYLDMWVVTDKKVIDANQKSLFSREVSTVEIEKIQDVTVDVDGLIATIFGYGTLKIQTAGDAREFVMTFVADAEACKQTILESQSRVREEVLQRQSAYMASGISHSA